MAAIIWIEFRIGHELGLTFLKEAEGALVPMTAEVKEKTAGAAAASSDGRPVVFPAATAAMDVRIENRTAHKRQSRSLAGGKG